MPELLSPAGNWESAKAAVENGADAIYFGLERFNARMRSLNFSEADLPKLISFLHSRGVKGYVTFNTLIFPKELAEAEQYLRSIIAAGVDAAIVQDIGICRLIRHISPDFPIHASTQMTITSAAGVEFAQSLGCELVVLARECSIKEISKIRSQTANIKLEIFVHGALCVAYSGQCLTSESLGGRSANRGECAQACRMAYKLIANGIEVDLGDRQYLLSPQDLAGLELLPQLIETGVSCLKIEGRLKSPEYVANVTHIYRQALQNLTLNQFKIEAQDRYNLEMAFSRGLYSGWFNGIDNQALVHGRFGKKRGVYLGQILEIGQDYLITNLQAPLKPGDGIVIDSGHPDQKEEGGRIYHLRSSKDGSQTEVMLSFGKDAINWQRVNVGDRLWKTSDPELDKAMRQSYSSEQPQFQQPLKIEVYGSIGTNLVAIARDSQANIVQVESELPLVAAHTKPLQSESLRTQLGRLGNTPFRLTELENRLQGEVMLPISELNRIRRKLVEQLIELRSQPKRWQQNPSTSFVDLLPNLAPNLVPKSAIAAQSKPQLNVMVRNLEQLQAILDLGISTCYCEFEDPRNYRQAVKLAHKYSSQIFIAPPRISKPNENWILQQLKAADPDGYLIRNYDHLEYLIEPRIEPGIGTQSPSNPKQYIGDFSLNIANPITASYLIDNYPLERITASYDLNVSQLRDLVNLSPANWWEVTIHQQMPMFHMEHCVFCAFLSTGTDYTNCGRPCDTEKVKLSDRTGVEHILKADAGCRNTLFNGTAQTGAEYVHSLMQLGVKHFRLEFVDQSAVQVTQIVTLYQKLLTQELSGNQVWQLLKSQTQIQNQLGVTRGSL